MPYILSLPALADLDEILAYLSVRSPSAARCFLADFEACFERIGSHPEIGHLQRFPTEAPARFAVVGDFHVVYEAASQPVVVLRIIHGKRDLPASLERSS
jgi:toxin ParE1/3/4